jgi:alkylation response protein AidB-like acyl-CoA dehydrogenase
VSMHARALLAWIAVGLAGLALAAGVTYATTQLSSQRIGLSAEPPSAGEQLAPRRAARPTGERGQRRHERRAHREQRRHSGDPDD